MVILILIGYLFLDKVDALPSLEKVAKALDKVTLFFVSSVRSSSGYQGLIRTYPATHFFKFFRLTNESKDNILLWDPLSANEEADNKILIVQRVYN